MTERAQPRRRSALAEADCSLDIGRIVPGHCGDRPACPRRSRPVASGYAVQRRFGEILNVLRDIDTAAPDGNGSSWLLESISTMLRADQAVLISRDPLTEKMDCVLYNHDPNLCRSYADYFRHLDPTHLGDQLMRGSSPLPRPPARMVFDLRGQLDYGTLVSTEFYNDFFRPADIHYDLLTFVSADAVRGALCLFRSRRRRPFSNEDAAVMELMAPFLCNHARRVVETDLATLAEATADKGIVVCDPRGRVLYCNSLARDLCMPGSKSGGDHIVDPHARPGHAFRAADVPPQRMSPLAVGAFLDPGALSNICDAEIMVRNVDLNGNGAARVVTFMPHAGWACRLTEVLRDRFALSDREIEVLQCVIDGATNKEIARKLFIAERTVKWHMQKIADKVGARTRTGIVHAVNEAVPRSPRYDVQ